MELLIRYNDLVDDQINIDWAGVLVERATGLSLNDYLHQHIFKPLELTNISMIPTQSMKANLAYMNYRSPDGRLSGRDHLLRRPLIVESAEDIRSCFNSGGAGCFAKPQEYARKLLFLTIHSLDATQTENRDLGDTA